MNTIRRYAADDAHVTCGTACDETLGDLTPASLSLPTRKTPVGDPTRRPGPVPQPPPQGRSNPP